MSAGQPFWFNDFEVLELSTVDGDEDFVAGIIGAEIEAEMQTLEELYTADTTEREAVKQAQKAVPLSFDYVKFDGDFAESWLGGAGSTATEWTDTSDPALFELTGDFRSKDGDQQMEITVTGIYFPSFPFWTGSMDEYVERGLSGTGSNVTNYEVSDVTST